MPDACPADNASLNLSHATSTRVGMRRSHAGTTGKVTSETDGAVLKSRIHGLRRCIKRLRRRFYPSEDG